MKQLISNGRYNHETIDLNNRSYNYKTIDLSNRIYNHKTLKKNLIYRYDVSTWF